MQLKKIKRTFAMLAFIAIIPGLFTNNFWVFGISMYLFGCFAGIRIFIDVFKISEQ